MSRVVTAYYGADPTTQFAWATTDSDRFDREQDLYRLAQAVEHHDHSNTRGLAVARIATGAILEPMYGALSVSTRALADLAVTGPKIAAGAVSDDKLAVAKLPLTGGVVNGNLQTIVPTAPTTGYYFMGNAGNYIACDGTNIVIQHVAGGRIYQLGDSFVQRPGAPTTGFTFYGSAAHYLGFDGSNLVADGQIIRTALNTADAPLGAVVAFRTLAELTAAGARWARDTNFNGRLLVGAGQSGGIPENFAENTFYGTTWAPLTYMGYTVNSGTLAVSAPATSGTGSGPFLAAAASANNSTGATNVDINGHTHPVTGAVLSGQVGVANAGASFLPPMLSVIWGRRIA